MTVKIDETLWKEARHRAVDEGVSVSAWVAELMESALRERDSFEENRREALRELAEPLHLGGRPLSREELHER